MNCDGPKQECNIKSANETRLLDSNIHHGQITLHSQRIRDNTESSIDLYTPDLEYSMRADELSEASTVIIGDSESLYRENNESSGVSENDWSCSSSVNLIGTKKFIQSLGSNITDKNKPASLEPSKTNLDMVLNTEWAQVEIVNLVNDGTGLGFGIIGGKSTGVVVKTILPGGVADRDNRLQSGDHILQIGDVNLRGMGSEQVATVLRQSGTNVRLVVARPIEPTSPDYQTLESHAPIVPTKVLGDPEELSRHLLHNNTEGFNSHCIQKQGEIIDECNNEQGSDFESHTKPGLIMEVVHNSLQIEVPSKNFKLNLDDSLYLLQHCNNSIEEHSLPETERFSVELKKDICGLGITVAGYVCEKEELSGIFVKSISKGSAAESSQKIQINDRIVKVNNFSLQGYSNHEAVEVLRNAGNSVHLFIERYLRGPKYEQLQQAIAASEIKLPQLNSPSITSLPSFSFSTDGDTLTEVETEINVPTQVIHFLQANDKNQSAIARINDVDDTVDLSRHLITDSTPQTEESIKTKWKKIVGEDIDILIAHIRKSTVGSGLGISLEGTVDVENGKEVRPHHYIRSILPEGPVGVSGILRSADELLEVNGVQLFGTNHTEVVTILRELPLRVRLVCGRKKSIQATSQFINLVNEHATVQSKGILVDTSQNSSFVSERLVKAKSDESLNGKTSSMNSQTCKVKSRSLELLTGLATWNTQPQIVELMKGEMGLGFSILDYQDPTNSHETVIIIRSLVPGGVAETNGQLIPGDRILFVNNVVLTNATLSEAVEVLKQAPKGKVQLGVAKPSRLLKRYMYVSTTEIPSTTVNSKT
ncbi:patj homolog isoform X3 [Cotesia typhae]|uniref:patj homolog isoform X3 n=1 Tax=Cotesia typhae TaxID=2053667 RepID=UPI003D68F8AB